MLAAVAYAAAAVYLSWPLVGSLGDALVDPMALGGGVWGRADLDLLVWVVAWGAHALATQPAQFFDGNIFYPAPNVLASSEHLAGLLPLTAPTFVASGNAVLTYNVAVLAVVTVAALSTFALVRAWTRSGAAGFLAGAAFAFAPLNVLGWARLHVTAVHFFPLILLLAWRAARAPRAGTLPLLALVTSLQLLAGVYVAYELACLLVAFWPALWWEARRHGRRVWPLAVACATAGLALVPVAVAYWRARAAHVLPDFAAEPPVTLAAVQLPALGTVLGANLTWPVVALAIAGTLAARRIPWHLRAGLVAVAATGALLALGPEAPLVPGTSLPGLYSIALKVVPGFSGMRAPPRFLVLPLLAVAVLAGIGAAELSRLLVERAGRFGRSLALALTLGGAVALVLARAPDQPLALARGAVDDPDMQGYHWLRGHGLGRAVLEVPALVSPLEGRTLAATGRYMRGATVHWLPLLNGYTGHPPPNGRLLMTLAQRLPDPLAFSDLCALANLGWIVVHGSELPSEAPAWRAEAEALGLRPAGHFGDDVLYRVERPCGELEPRLRDELLGKPVDTTLRAVPRDPLARGAARGRVTGRLPRRVVSALYTRLWVTVENRSRVRWPGLSTLTRGTVALQARWSDAATGALQLESLTSPLARDLGPGERIRVQVGSMVPPPGDYVLEIGLLQEGVGWFADQPGGKGVLRHRVTAAPWKAMMSTT